MFGDLNKGQAGGRLKNARLLFIGCFVSIYISFPHDGHSVSFPRLLDFLFLGNTMTGASLEWETIPGGRRLPLLSPPQSQSSGFQSVSPLISGINFTNRLSEDRSLTNQIF